MILNLKSDSTYSRIVQISQIFFIINLDSDMSRHESWINCASKASGLCTLVYRIEVQDQINVQVEKFLENIKRAGKNRPE